MKKRNIRCLEQKLWKICKKVSVLRLEMMLQNTFNPDNVNIFQIKYILNVM